MDEQDTEHRLRMLSERARRWRIMSEARETCARLGREEIERTYGPKVAEEIAMQIEGRPSRFRKLLTKVAP